MSLRIWLWKEIKKLSENLGIIGVYDYEKQKEWEWKQLAKESVKDDLLKIEEGKKFIEENSKILEEKGKALEEDKNSFEKEKKALAKRMLEMNLSIKDIIKTTSLSKKEIEQLKNS